MSFALCYCVDLSSLCLKNLAALYNCTRGDNFWGECKIFLVRFEHSPALLRKNAQVNLIIGKREGSVASYCCAIRSKTSLVPVTCNVVCFVRMCSCL